MLHFLETNSNDPHYNLAFEEFVLLNRTKGDYLLLWQNDNAVIIGRHQNAEEEINRAFVENKGISVVRRTTGGGAVYHDMGNLNYSFITDVEDAEKLTMQKFTEPIIKALAQMGITAECSGRNDITIDGKKISGNAQRIHRGRILHHGTLLFNSDPQIISGALNVDPTKFVSKSAKSVRSRVANISDFLPEKTTLSQFKEQLIKSLGENEMVSEQLSLAELDEVKRLCDEKYSTWQWNFGSSPKYDRANKKRFSGGAIDIRLSVSEGVITAAAFFGDFMARKEAAEIADAIVGCRFDRAEIGLILDKFDLLDYFGSITKQEILEVMFY